MSRGNVEIILASWQAVNRGDLEALNELLHPKIEWRESDALPDAAVYRTREGALRSIQNFNAVFGELEWELAELIDADDGGLVLARTTACDDAGSGVPVEIRVAALWTLGDGCITRVQWYLDWDEALRAFEARPAPAPEQQVERSPSPG